jgi:hypothetical protein
MFFLNLNGLVEHLKLKRNKQSDSIKYILGFYIWSSIFSIISNGKQKPSELHMIAISVAVVVASCFIGYFIWHSFLKNNGGEGGEFFLDRILALTWVITLRSMLVFIPVFIIYIFLVSFLFGGSAGIYPYVIGIAMSVVFLTYYYVTVMNRSLRIISGLENQVSGL